MRNLLRMSVTCVVLGMAAGQAGAQPAKDAFPLAAPAGKDSNARQVAPPGAVNQGPFDNRNWKYGNAFPMPPGAKIWNPAKLKLMQGGKLVGGKEIHIVDRKTLEIVGSVNPPGILGPGHHIATDSKGHIYIAQTAAGLQKLTFKGMAPGGR